MKRSIIVVTLLATMLCIPFVMSDNFGQADANVKPVIMVDAPIIQQSMSAKTGQVWTLAGESVANGYFVVSKVERVDGIMVVHGQVEGLVKNIKDSRQYVADLPSVTLSLGAFNRSVVHLVGEKSMDEYAQSTYEAWIAAGSPVSTATIAEIAERRYS